jgi:RHH-type proline utilization regulon transcriptional repressor/proline dehydrogenase/delta 1-pyrroline-5-carboxylate dehydrogenase
MAGFGLFNAFGLKVIALASRLLPKPVIFAVNTQIKLLSKGIILPAESKQLARQINRRAKKGIKLNINVLGEAVLGDHEASERFGQVMQMMSRPEVDYVSVKLSSVASQIIALDRVGTLERVSEKLRQIYRQSIATGTFVNLDMEEFRDLRLTVDAFKLVLSEDEFKNLKLSDIIQKDRQKYFSDFLKNTILIYDTSVAKHISTSKNPLLKPDISVVILIA